MAHILVAMSGGVDSASSAALLSEAGHQVTGVTFVFADSPAVPSFAAIEAARATCELLGVEHKVIDARERFLNKVIEPFAHEYSLGRTPNPCVVCNRALKFALTIEVADEIGAELIASGHYATIKKDSSGRSRLHRGTNVRKDQSYFLYRVTPTMLDRLMFPLAGISKEEVRTYAARRGLPTAYTPDSQDVCFLGDGDRFDLIERLHPEALEEGKFIDGSGNVMGRHRGIAHYTVGQRRGLGIAAAEPLYVVGINAERNEVIVGSAKALEMKTFVATNVVMHEELPLEGETLLIQVRYKMKPVSAHVRPVDENFKTVGALSDSLSEIRPQSLIITPDEPISGVAPGQSIVCYRDTLVVGGGMIR